MSARHIYRIGPEEWRSLSLCIRKMLEIGGGPTGRTTSAWVEPIARSESWPLVQKVPLVITVPPGSPPDQDAARRMVRSVVMMDRAGVEIPQSEVDQVLARIADRAAPLLLALLPGFAAVSLSPKLAAVLVAAYKAAQRVGVAPDPAAVANLVAREVSMTLLKTWGALAATLLAIVAAALTLFGQGEAAKVVQSIADMIGWDSSIIGGLSAGVLVAAVAAVGRRLYSLGRKSVGPMPPGAPTGGAAKLLWRFGGLIGTVGTIAVVVLGALAKPEMAAQVNGLLVLLGGKDEAVFAAMGTVVPAIISLLAYAKAKRKPATT